MEAVSRLVSLKCPSCTASPLHCSEIIALYRNQILPRDNLPWDFLGVGQVIAQQVNLETFKAMTEIDEPCEQLLISASIHTGGFLISSADGHYKYHVPQKVLRDLKDDDNLTKSTAQNQIEAKKAGLL